MLWQIGKPDGTNREFFLAPNRYQEFRADGFFVVGQSDSGRDWPYVQPGPVDAWAGSRPHTFSIVFGLKEVVSQGACTLRIELLDTQSQTPPALRIELNGRHFDQRMPAGAGDASVFGEPARGKKHRFAVEFPAALLRAGPNELSLTTRTGSWILYDWIGFEGPSSLQLAEVSGTVVGSIQSPPVLVERQGRLFQTVQAAIRHFGEASRATARLTGANPLDFTLQRGAQTLEIATAEVEKETAGSLTIQVEGRTIAQRSVTLKPVRKWVVYLLPHSHVDIGYTHVQTEVEQAQWKYLEMAMDAARKSAGNPPGSRFKWNVEVLWAVDSYLKQATPGETAGSSSTAVKAGQVGLQALYGNELTGLCRPEELLRLLSCAQRLSQRAGVPDRTRP